MYVQRKRKGWTMRTRTLLFTLLVTLAAMSMPLSAQEPTPSHCQQMMRENPDMMRGMMSAMMADSAMGAGMMRMMMENATMRQRMMRHMMEDPQMHQEMMQMMKKMPAMKGMGDMGGMEGMHEPEKTEAAPHDS
jgi:hypothetical protein